MRTPDAPVAAPGVPTSVAARAVDEDSILVTWSAPTSGGAVAFYDVRYREDGTTNWTELTGIGSGSRQINGLDALTGYEAQVKAVNAGGASAWTPTPPVSATTTAPPPTDLPGAPTGLSAVQSGYNIVFSWNAVAATPAVGKYEVRYHDGTQWHVLDDNVTSTSYTHSGAAIHASGRAGLAICLPRQQRKWVGAIGCCAGSDRPRPGRHSSAQCEHHGR